MEKLLWNTLGAILFVANIFSILFCALIGSTMWFVALIVVVIIDGIYFRHRPTWLGV